MEPRRRRVTPEAGSAPRRKELVANSQVGSWEIWQILPSTVVQPALARG
ncbi:hypothetical protein LINGRAHAP2_LOCUS4391 [Linum grandiflorum]